MENSGRDLGVVQVLTHQLDKQVSGIAAHSAEVGRAVVLGSNIDSVSAPRRRQTASLLVVLVLCGCGGASASGPTTVGTLSKETASNAIMQDITTVRTAFDSGQADDAVMAIYDLVSRAGEQEADQGAKTIRNELPGLVAQLNAAAPAVLAHLSALELQTDGGRSFRDVVMKLLRAQTKYFNDLDKDVATKELTRGALVRWEERNNALSDRLGAEIAAVVNSLPAEQRAAVRQAVYKFFAR